MKRLLAATLEIAHDNGAVNRNMTEVEVVWSIAGALNIVYTQKQLADAEKELAALTQDEFMIACCGDASELKSPLTTGTNEILETIFNELPIEAV